MEYANISVIKIKDVLLVTVPSEPDDDTIQDLQARVLQAMDHFSPRGLILDISTVHTFDSFFARTIAETAQMVALMGGRTIIAGMQPVVAITATELGITLENIASALNVDIALDMMIEVMEEGS